MAKHFYQIPLEKSLIFTKENKSSLNRFVTDKKRLAYYRDFGKSYYNLEIEEFIKFFKIDKDLDYALKTVEYFNSKVFIEHIQKVLNFSMFKLQENGVNGKEFFYAFCYLYSSKDKEGFNHFMQKSFLHYHNGFKNESDIKIDYKEFSLAIAKSKRVEIKESFGENEKGSFFKLFVNGKQVVDEQGKRIKTLRKKAYKKLFYYLLDL